MKKVIRVALIGLCLNLTGCVYQSVDAYEAKIAEKWCTDKGGLDHISSYYLGNVKVFCKGTFINNHGSTKRHKASIDKIERELLRE